MKKMSSMDQMANKKKAPKVNMPTKSMPGMEEKPKIQDFPDRHAFVMVGTQTLFLCHLTMVYTAMPNHMYEFVLQASLHPAAWQQYLKEYQRQPDATYFLGNSANDLMTIPDLHIGACDSFQADIWRGIPPEHHYDSWPWEKQKPILSDVTVQVERTVRLRHFNFTVDYPSSLSYFLFGKGSEAYLYHYQTREPDFDQVVQLAEAPKWLTPSQLQSGVVVNFPKMASTPVYCSNPLTEKTTYEVQYEGISIFPYQEMAIDRSVWFSTKITNSVTPCLD